MKTKTQVLKDNPEHKTLINAVISRIGMDSVQDVVKHGIDGGFSGFIYYVDTRNFYRRHRKAINQWVKNMAAEFGEDAIGFVQSFGCLKGSEWRDEIGTCLYGGKLNDTETVENALAWFTAEEVCRLFDN